jgi:16S rRNA U1498 N3-methylase RsmE
MVLLTGPMHKYIIGVLRKRPGDRIDLIDGKGYLYRVHHPERQGKDLISRCSMWCIILRR